MDFTGKAAVMAYGCAALTLMILDAVWLNAVMGPLYQAERLGGAYTLAAIQVPEPDYDRVAGLVNGHPEVAHNYRREHAFNMWFVVAAVSPAAVARTLSGIERECNYPVVEFPKLREYFVDLDLPV